MTATTEKQKTLFGFEAENDLEVNFTRCLRCAALKGIEMLYWT